MSTMREFDVRSERDFSTADGNAGVAIPDDDTSGPLQLGAILIGALAITLIVVNAAFMQSRRHPAPIFDTRSQGDLFTGNISPKSAARILPKPAPDGETDQVAKVQELLRNKGYEVGEVDGVFGTRTENAIIDFERKGGYPETGAITPLLLKRLKRAVPAAALSGTKPPVAIVKPQVNSSVDREDILLVQRVLSDLGYGPIGIDGVHGSQTAQAIQRFELDRGMPITGAIGDRIIAELVLIGGVNPIAAR